MVDTNMKMDSHRDTGEGAEGSKLPSCLSFGGAGEAKVPF